MDSQAKVKQKVNKIGEIFKNLGTLFGHPY